MNIHEKTGEIILKEFESSNSANGRVLWEGIIHKEYKTGIEKFRSVNKLTKWGYESANPIYENSMRIKDWFEGYTLIPIVNETRFSPSLVRIQFSMGIFLSTKVLAYLTKTRVLLISK